jgi:hypothetical protein
VTLIGPAHSCPGLTSQTLNVRTFSHHAKLSDNISHLLGYPYAVCKDDNAIQQ